MSHQTHFVVQSFDSAKGDQLKAGAPIMCRTEEGARRTAEKLASSKAGGADPIILDDVGARYEILPMKQIWMKGAN